MELTTVLRNGQPIGSWRSRAKKQRAAKGDTREGKRKALVGSPATRLCIWFVLLTASTSLHCDKVVATLTLQTFGVVFLSIKTKSSRGHRWRARKEGRCLAGDQVARRPKRLLLLLVRFFSLQNLRVIASATEPSRCVYIEIRPDSFCT